jgi:hypothetical protein
MQVQIVFSHIKRQKVALPVADFPAYLQSGLEMKILAGHHQILHESWGIVGYTHIRRMTCPYSQYCFAATLCIVW